jgi:integrase
MQRQRYRLFRRKNGTYYSFENDTGRQTSLFTKDRGEATGLLAAKNQATAQPILNVAMAKVYLSAKSPELLTRTWGELIEVMMNGYTGATAVRWGKFRKSAPMRMLENLPIYLTESNHLLAVLDHKKAGVSTNVWLRILHNRALDLGWLLAPVMPKRAWPKIQYGVCRAITEKEHEKILESEQMPDYALFFKLLWQTGGSQSDVAHLNAEDIDWSARRLFYSRRKLASKGGGQASLVIGMQLEAVLRQLPYAGPLFPRLGLLSEDERASHFRKVCLRVGLSGVTLHSYRYAWAERAFAAGMPEREAQAHLGHGSKAVHAAYARRAEVVTLPLEHYESMKDKKLLVFTPLATEKVDRSMTVESAPHHEIRDAEEFHLGGLLGKTT